MIKAAIFGYGTVGSGIYEVLTRNSAVIQGKAWRQNRSKICSGSERISW